MIEAMSAKPHARRDQSLIRQQRRPVFSHQLARSRADCLQRATSYIKNGKHCNRVATFTCVVLNNQSAGRVQSHLRLCDIAPRHDLKKEAT